MYRRASSKLIFLLAVVFSVWGGFLLVGCGGFLILKRKGTEYINEHQNLLAFG